MLTADGAAVGYGVMDTNGGDRMAGSEFRQLRQRECPQLNLQEFARVAGVSPKTLSEYERDRTGMPRAEFRRKIHDAIERVQRGEVDDNTLLDGLSDDGMGEEWEVRGLSISLRAKNYATLGDYRRAREEVLRVIEALSGKGLA